MEFEPRRPDHGGKLKGPKRQLSLVSVETTFDSDESDTGTAPNKCWPSPVDFS